MSSINDMVEKLYGCPPGREGWCLFEDVCVEILEYLFVPPLNRAVLQARTLSGTNRKDAAFPNRNYSERNNWSLLLQELNARMILFEFKNHDISEIGTGEILQTSNYLTEPMGRLAIIISAKNPSSGAHIQRNSIYSRDKKVILFLTKEHLKEMLYIKERGEEPSDLIVDLIEHFYLQHE